MSGKRKLFEQQTRAYWERIWLHPNPPDSERHQRLLSLIPQTPCRVIDLGCGRGEIALELARRGYTVTALDVSANALKHLTGVTTVRSCLPYLTLDDASFDLVICSDVIAELPKPLHRLLISELARLVTKEGSVLCSTPLDLNSLDALEQFVALFETEFTITSGRETYGRLDHRLRHFCTSPERFTRAAHDPEYRKRQLAKRERFSKLWFRLHSTPTTSLFWSRIKFPKPSSKVRFERLSEFLFGERGISHVALLGKKRQLMIN